ncbi:MAG: tetratricopeptide repeat protein [Acidobacteria bacterium]|nr:tetratricopeptide repeat protein [Acidobacteriota bacterium]
MSDARPTMHLRIGGTALALLFGSALPLFAMALIADPGGPDQELYNQGRSLIFEESWTKARTVFENLARRFPESPYLDDSLYWTAFSLLEEGRPAMGYETLRTLTRKYPESPWNEDARALMVRCAEAALKEHGNEDGTRTARAGDATEYRRFLEESTRDRSAQVSLLAIDTLLHQDPQKAADLLGRVEASGRGQEGAVVLLDRFFGKDLVKVTFDAIAAGFSEGNVHVLVRDGGQALKLTLSEAIDLAGGRGEKRFNDTVRREMRDRILEAERSIVTQGPSREAEGFRSAGARTATIVRVIDGEVHYYTNGAETVRIVVLRRAAGFNAENVQIYTEGAGGIKHIQIADVTGPEAGPSARGLSSDSLHYLSQSLGVIQLDLSNPPK